MDFVSLFLFFMTYIKFPEVLVIVQVDTNDADYVEKHISLTRDEFEKYKQYLDILSQAPIDFGWGEVADCDLEEWLNEQFKENGLSDFTGEDIINMYCPDTNYGFHTIEAVTIMTQ